MANSKALSAPRDITSSTAQLNSQSGPEGLGELALLIPTAGLTQVPEGLEGMTPEQRREYVQGLSDDERQALKKQLRAQWDAMSEEERTAARRDQADRRAANKEAMRKQWDSASEEEREVMRAKRDAQKQKQREVWNNMSDEE